MALTASRGHSGHHGPVPAPGSNSSGQTHLAFYYQPIYGTDGRPVIHEALVRQLGPDGRVSAPVAILDRLLSPENIGRFTEFTIEKAAETLSCNPDAGIISINLSPEQLCRTETLLQLASLPTNLRQRLTVEITEQELTDAEAYRLYAGEIANLGVSLVLDDLLPHEIEERLLPGLAVGGVKLDRSLLPRVLAGKADAEMHRSMKHLTSLRLSITVEGLDSVDQIGLLSRCGADRFQGFGLGMPAPTLRGNGHFAGD